MEEDIQNNLVRLVLHYRNLAISLGASPDQMATDDDRQLVDQEIVDDHNELSPLGPNVWEEIGFARTRIQELEELLRAYESYEKEESWDEEY